MPYRLRPRIGASLTCAACAVLLVADARGVTIETVSVGNPGNAPQSSVGHGRVDYEYRIGKYEITNDQYVEFLNAKAADGDPLGLYEPNFMGGTEFRGGINRDLVLGKSIYSAKPNMGNKPVNNTTWYDAIRFINWLHNGQGDGDTETGAYTLEGGTPTPSNGTTITRNPGAIWFMPTLNEWFKAAYHQPTEQGGDADGYWLYPTGSNTAPTPATANAVGDITNPGANVVNYQSNVEWNGIEGHLTTVGSAGPLSTSYYGTFDQGGNAWEWNETPFLGGQSRGSRGGDFASTTNEIAYTLNAAVGARFEGGGFRVATLATATCDVAGDYNCNGAVDAADYVVWRRSFGESGEGLAADGDGNTHVDDLDYDFWAARFGNSAGSGGAAVVPAAAVPEPRSIILGGFVAACLLLRIGSPRRVMRSTPAAISV